MSKAEHIEEALEAEFHPSHLEVVNESHMHNVAPGSESHFKVVIVCEAFAQKPLIARHRAVQAVVKMEELGIHALALHTFAPSEWQASADTPSIVTESPDCHGGNGK